MKFVMRARRNKENRWKYSFTAIKLANCLLAVGVFSYSETVGKEDLRSLCLMAVLFTQLLLNLCVTVVEVAATLLRVKTLYLLVSFMYLSLRELSIGLVIPMRLGLRELQVVIKHDQDSSLKEVDLPSRICLILLSILSLAVCMMTYKVRDSILKANNVTPTNSVTNEVIQYAMKEAFLDMKQKARNLCIACGEAGCFFQASLYYIVGDERCTDCRQFALVENYCC